MIAVKLALAPEQAEIVQSPARIKIAACGRRYGKTTTMAAALAKTALEYPGSRSWYVANDYSLALAQARTMKRCKAFMGFVRHAYAQFPPRFDMKNGSEIAFRSGDRMDLLLGAGLKLICIDEAARAGKDLFYRVLLPMTADTDGQVILASTFDGRNWFYDLAEEGKQGGLDKKTWVIPTSRGPRFQGEKGRARLANLRAQFPEGVWRQEFECEPLASGNAVFRFVERCIGGQALMQGIPGRHYCLAIDIGRVKDHTSLVVLEIETETIVYAESLPLGLEHAVMAQKAAHVARLFNNATVVVDSTGGASGGRAESYVRFYSEAIRGLREIPWTRDTKVNMVNHAALMIEQAKIKIPAAHKELIAQLKLYSYRMSEGAILPYYGAPAGEHDDAVSAFIMALWSKARGWVGTGKSMDLGRLIY